MYTWYKFSCDPFTASPRPELRLQFSKPLSMEPKSAVLAIAMLCLALPQATLSQRTPPAVETPAPAPAPQHVNLTELLALAGPYGTFLDYLTRTDVIRTFQSQANATDHDGQGVTVFAPEDSAFAAVDGAALSKLIADQLRTLMLCHGAPRYHPLSSFAALAASGPVPTFAGGGGCVLNVTDAAGRIHVASGWTRAARLFSSVYSTPPIAVYALDRVLLPKQVFPTQPTVAPVPAPTERGASKSSSCRLGARRVLVAFSFMSFGFLMM